MPKPPPVPSTSAGTRVGPATGERPASRRGGLWIAASSILVGAYDQAAIGVVLDPLTRRWHLGTTEVAALSTAAVAGMLVGGALAGVLADRFGRRGLLIADIVLLCGAALGAALSPNYAYLITFRVLGGVGVGADYTIALVYLAEVAPRTRRGRWMAATLWGANLGMLAAYAAGALLLRVGWGWRGVLGLGALAALPVIWQRRHLDETFAFRQGAPLGLAALLRHGLGATGLRHRARGMLAWFSYQVGDSGLSLFLPVMLAEILSRSAATGSAAALVVKAVTIPASLATVFLIDRWGRRRLQVSGFLVRALALGALAGLLLAGTGSPIYLVGALLALGLAAGSAGPDKTTAIVPAEGLDRQTRATEQGVSQGAGRLGGIVGPLGYVVLATSLGPGAGLAWFAGFALLGGLVSIGMPETAGRDLG